MGQINKRRYTKVLGSLLDYIGVIRIDGHDLLWEEQTDKSEQNARNKNDLNQQIKNALNRLLISCTIVLRGQDKSCRAQSHAQERENIVEIIGKRGGGNRHLAKPSQHDGIHHV